MAEIVRLPRRPRKACEPREAAIVPFPDRIGLTPPPYDPTNPAHVRAFNTFWHLSTIELGRKAPEGHPLRTWYLAELRKT